MESCLFAWAGMRQAPLDPRLGIIAELGGLRTSFRVVRTSEISSAEPHLPLADPGAAVARVGTPFGPALLVGSGRLVRELAQAVLGGPAELPLARPATEAERAVWAWAVACAFADVGIEGQVDPVAYDGRWIWGAPRATAIEVACSGQAVGTAFIILPSELAAQRPRRPLPPAAQAPWLASAVLSLPVVVARATLTRAELSGCRARDVLVPGWAAARGEGRLLVGRGGFACKFGEPHAPIEVTSRYQRDPMDEQLSDDLVAEVLVSAGSARMSVRRVLDLAPGEVVPLQRPAASEVDLIVAGKVIASGELVDVDGELAVRILRLAQP